MNDKIDLYSELKDAIGDEGCCVTCSPDDIIHDEEGWKLFLEGFMEPWFLGKTLEEAKEAIREYASQGFGLS